MKFITLLAILFFLLPSIYHDGLSWSSRNIFSAFSSSSSVGTSSFFFTEAKASTPSTTAKGGVGIGGYMGRALIDLIISLTSSRIQRSTDVNVQVQECLEEELPTSAQIWIDDQGMKAKETPEHYISRIILDKHPDTCGFVACLLNRSLVSSLVMRSMTGKLLFVSASLVASTPDPAALFRGFLQNGVPLTYTMGMGNNPSSSSSTDRMGNYADSTGNDNFNLLHKILSRDKSMLGDVANRLLQPVTQQNSHYALYLSAVGESLISRLLSESNRPAEEGTRIRNAVKSLVSNADVKPSSPSGSHSFNRRNSKENYLGRKISYSHIETLNNAMSQVLITTLITYLRQYNSTYTWSLVDDHPLGRLLVQQDKYGRNPLHVAVMTNNYAAIELLIDEVRALEYQVQRRLASLQLIPEDIVSSSSSTRTTLSSKFLRTIIEQEDIFGYTPYMSAVTLGQSRSAQTLLNLHQEIGSSKGTRIAGISSGEIDGNEEASPVSTSSSSSFVTNTLHRPYRRGKGKVFMYNDNNELVDITSTLTESSSSSSSSSSSTPSFPFTPTDASSNGGWSYPTYIPPRLNEAVQASKQQVLRNTSSSSGSFSSGSYTCDIDVIDFTCTYASDKETCVQKITANQTFFTRDMLKEYYIPNRPVLLKGLGKHWPVRTLWNYQNFLMHYGKFTMNTVDIPYAPVFGKKASDTLTVIQHVQALQSCTPAMVRGEEKAPFGLSAEICALYADDGRPMDEDDDSTNSIVSETRKETGKELKKTPASSPKPYLFYRLTPGEPLSVNLIDDMTLVPWFLNTKLPRMVPVSFNESIEIHANGEPDTPSSALPLESLMMPLPQPPSPQFYLGGPGTGAPPHYHEDAWNILAYGKKVWYMVPPIAAEYMTVPIHDYVLEVLPKRKDKAHGSNEKIVKDGNISTNRTVTSFWGPNSRPLTCIQEAGDIIYVPHGWGHGVMNIETVIGYAVEFHSPFQRY